MSDKTNKFGCLQVLLPLCLLFQEYLEYSPLGQFLELKYREASGESVIPCNSDKGFTVVIFGVSLVEGI